MLCQCKFKLSPRMSEELLWSRFINTHGLPGRNIPTDLHMEHLNRVLKEAIRSLGVSKTNAAIERVANALGELSPVLDQFDKENSVMECSKARKIPSFEPEPEHDNSRATKSQYSSTYTVNQSSCIFSEAKVNSESYR